MKELLKHSTLCWITFTAILIHIAYMCYVRQEFAVGGEFFVYLIAVIAAAYRSVYHD